MYPYKGWDGDTATYWTKGVIPAYFYVDFPPFCDYVIDRIELYDTAHNQSPDDIDVEGGTHNADGSISWTSLATGLVPTSVDDGYGYVTFSNSTAYRYYKMKINSLVSGTTYPRIWAVKYMGPDGQAPGIPTTLFSYGAGQTYSDANHYTTNVFANAFDGNLATEFISSGASRWAKIDFGATASAWRACTRWTFKQSTAMRTNHFGTATIEGSTNDTDWTLLLTCANELKSGHYHDFWWANSTPYRYYRINYSIASGYIYVGESALYGPAIPKTWCGLSFGSVKTVNGLALASIKKTTGLGP
jgi:hypothetical protein